MRKILTAIIILTVAACAKKRSPTELQDNLKDAMAKFLILHRDTTRIKFKVLDVYYYEDKEVFDCEYKVRMIVPETHTDTIGMMMATVSKDFQTVKRKN